MISIDIITNYGRNTALLIRCSTEEAAAIRASAKKQGRTISSCVLRAVKTRLKVEQQMEKREEDFFQQYMRRVTKAE